jgi:hypothetical protein
MTDKKKQVKVGKAKGRPMLTWVGKKPLTSVAEYKQTIKGGNGVLNGSTA